MKTIFDTSQELIIPKGYEGCKIEEHYSNGKIDLSKLSLHLEPEQKSESIKSEILRERMKGKGLNANVLDFLLKKSRF